MKKLFFIVFLFFLCSLPMSAMSDFEFFKSISQYDKIELKNSYGTILIKNDYTVRIYEDVRGNDRLFGTLELAGTVCWDREKSQMYIDLSGSFKGTYIEAISFSDHTEDWKCTGYLCIIVPKLIFTLNGEGDGFYSLEIRRFDVTIPTHKSGNQTMAKFIGGSGKLYYGKKNSSSDEFGRWQWNNDRTEIWLKSVNTKDTFSIYVDSNKTYSIAIKFCSSNISGGTQNANTTDFDFKFGETNATLSFVKDATCANRYKYGTYNRFMNEWNYNATSIISQIANQTDMLLDYTSKENGKQTAVFDLEGLELIMSYIEAR